MLSSKVALVKYIKFSVSAKKLPSYFAMSIIHGRDISVNHSTGFVPLYIVAVTPCSVQVKSSCPVWE